MGPLHQLTQPASPLPSPVPPRSLGVVLWELVTHEVPQRGFLHMPAPDPHRSPAQLLQLILDCVDQKPEARPTAHQVGARCHRLLPGDPYCSTPSTHASAGLRPLVCHPVTEPRTCYFGACLQTNCSSFQLGAPPLRFLPNNQPIT